MIKNETFNTIIEDITEQGEGIGKIEAFPLFIKDTIIGDEIEGIVTNIKKGYGYGRMLKLIKPSPFRVEARCPAAAACGGCQLQALSYKKQLEFKQNKVRMALERIGGFKAPVIRPVIGMDNPWFYRNKAQYPIGRDSQGNIVAGFYAGRTHHIVETPVCYIGSAVNSEILEIIKSYMKNHQIRPYDETSGKGLVRHVLIREAYATKEIMVCLVINGARLPFSEELAGDLTKISGIVSISYSINKERSNVILGKTVKTFFGKGYITEQLNGISYQISPLSFFQVNSRQAERLFNEALTCANLTGKETVWDLYCGTGSISLAMAKHAKQVYGVEIIPEAIDNARENAEINNITNAEFFVGRAELLLPVKYETENIHADVIVVDPPRKGCGKVLLETIIRMSPKRIVYVSCDAATLARDLKYLCLNGYDLGEVQPVDMFPMTVGVETMVGLSR